MSYISPPQPLQKAICDCGKALVESPDPTGHLWMDKDSAPPICSSTWNCEACGNWYVRWTQQQWDWTKRDSNGVPTPTGLYQRDSLTLLEYRSDS